MTLGDPLGQRHTVGGQQRMLGHLRQNLELLLSSASFFLLWELMGKKRNSSNPHLGVLLAVHLPVSIESPHLCEKQFLVLWTIFWSRCPDLLTEGSHSPAGSMRFVLCDT